jgi:LacI family transcriptional regulator
VEQRPTLLDVARLAGVSPKTVSRVVNGEAHVQEHTAARILEVVAALGYRRNSVAWQLRTGRRTTYIGLVIDDLENPFYSRVARGVEQVVHEHDAVLVIGSSEEAPEREQELVRQFCERHVDGLLLVPAGHGDQRFLSLQIDMGTVVVCIDRPPVGLKTDTVLFDNAGGAGQGLDHLVASGCRRIAVLGDSLDIYTIRERLAGFNSAAAKAGVLVEPVLVVTDVHTPDEAAGVVRTMLAGAQRPDGFFCCNNRLTIGAVTEVVRQQADVTIVGFDDFELASALPLRLALVSGDERELGRRAARLLFDRLTDPQRRRRRVVLPTQLSIRGSKSPGQGAGSNA